MLLCMIALDLNIAINPAMGMQGLDIGFQIGTSSMSAPAAYAQFSLVQFGPNHFHDLKNWWVLRVIGSIALVIPWGAGDPDAGP